MRRVDARVAEATPVPAEDPLPRIRELEAELRAARALLETRNESFRALLARLVETERLVHEQARDLRKLGRCEERLVEVEAERDAAVALATTLQQLRLYRYTRVPRAAYGFILRRLGMR